MGWITPDDGDAAAPEVLSAFASARASGLPAVGCYRAGVQAWRRRHPDQAPEYAAKRAVALILAHYAELRVQE